VIIPGYTTFNFKVIIWVSCDYPTYYLTAKMRIQHNLLDQQTLNETKRQPLMHS
jgi:hypothetical protein